MFLNTGFFAVINLNSSPQELSKFKSSSTNLFGLKDSKGNVVVKAIFRRIDDYHEGYARVKIGRKYGFINSAGKYIIEPVYQDARYFVDGNVWVKNETGWGYLNKDGHFLIEPQFDGLYQYDYPSFNKMGMLRVIVGENMGLIDTTGTYLIEPKYDYISLFRENLCQVKKDNLWGYFDIKGTYVIDLQYLGCSSFVNGKAAVLTPDKSIFVINQLNKIIDDISYFDFNRNKKNLFKSEIELESLYENSKATGSIQNFINGFLIDPNYPKYDIEINSRCCEGISGFSVQRLKYSILLRNDYGWEYSKLSLRIPNILYGQAKKLIENISEKPPFKIIDEGEEYILKLGHPKDDIIHDLKVIRIGENIIEIQEITGS